MLIDNPLHDCESWFRDSFECCERGRKWVWPTRLAFANENENEGRRAEVSLNDSAGIRDSRTRTRDGGGSESERLVLIRDSRTRTRGRREEVSLNDSLNHSPETRLNERTNERTNDSLWRTERRELIRGNESWNPSLVLGSAKKHNYCCHRGTVERPTEPSSITNVNFRLYRKWFGFE